MVGAATGFCRDCFQPSAEGAKRCATCGSPRLLFHNELPDLAIAHVDCDAFYAAVEKRDNPALRDKPVIVGGGHRGVVSTCCYIARIKGVRSAMPMFKALALCPEAVVVRPNMAKYAEAGRAVRGLMAELTPSVQPISIDEAFMDLTGTTRLHGMSPAVSLSKLMLRIEAEVGVTASVGLSHNKFLAKLASDMQKPRGFSVIGRAETLAVLGPMPVGAIWGVGPAAQKQLARRGLTHISQLQMLERQALERDFGNLGTRLYFLCFGEDLRVVETDGEAKSITAENTLFEDVASRAVLEAELWELAQKVSRRAKKAGLSGRTITLKLKTSKFASRTRAVSLGGGTNLAHEIYDAGCQLLAVEVGTEKFRLIGIGISRLMQASVDVTPALDARHQSQTKAELAMDKIRAKFGTGAVDKGIGFKPKV